MSSCLEEHEAGAIARGKDDRIEKRSGVSLQHFADTDDDKVQSLEVLHHAQRRAQKTA